MMDNNNKSSHLPSQNTLQLKREISDDSVLCSGQSPTNNRCIKVENPLEDIFIKEEDIEDFSSAGKTMQDITLHLKFKTDSQHLAPTTFRPVILDNQSAVKILPVQPGQSQRAVTVKSPSDRNIEKLTQEPTQPMSAPLIQARNCTAMSEESKSAQALLDVDTESNSELELLQPLDSSDGDADVENVMLVPVVLQNHVVRNTLKAPKVKVKSSTAFQKDTNVTCKPAHLKTLIEINQNLTATVLQNIKTLKTSVSMLVQQMQDASTLTQEVSKLVTINQRSLEETAKLRMDIKRLMNQFNKNPQEDNRFPLEIPVSSSQELAALEDILNDQDLTKLLVKKISSVGGTSFRSLIFNIMSALMQKNVAINFSMKGQRQKRAFIKTKLYGVVMDAAKRSPLHRCETDREIYDIMASSLACARGSEDGHHKKRRSNAKIQTDPEPSTTVVVPNYKRMACVDTTELHDSETLMETTTDEHCGPSTSNIAPKKLKTERISLGFSVLGKS